MRILLEAPIYTDGAARYQICKKGPLYRVETDTTEKKIPGCPWRLGMATALSDLWGLAKEKNLRLVIPTQRE